MRKWTQRRLSIHLQLIDVAIDEHIAWCFEAEHVAPHTEKAHWRERAQRTEEAKRTIMSDAQRWLDYAAKQPKRDSRKPRTDDETTG